MLSGPEQAAIARAADEGAGAVAESQLAGAAPEAARSSFRHDGLFWRRLAYWGATRAPVWWRRVGPSIVGGVVFSLLGDNRRSTIANHRRIQGSRGRARDALEALRTFVEFAYCVSETFEFECETGRPVTVEPPPGFDPVRDLPRDQGLIVLTSHFGSWEIGARMLQRCSRPVNLVMAREPNPTVEAFQREVRESSGLRIIHSDTSVFSSFNMIHALRRGEIVAIQLDRAAPGQVTRDVPFFGEPAPFQLGPFMLARMAGVPLWPVFVARVGERHYRILPEPMRRIPREATEAEMVAVMADVVGSFERRVREHPRQWFQFRPIAEDVATSRAE